MGVIRNYEDFTWHNQTIRGKSVNFVRVRIYKRANIITSDGAEDLVYTDATAIKQSPMGYLHISGHSVTIFSTGICDKSQVNSSKPSLYLHIKVCLASDFDISKLNDVEFLGKFYVMKALNGDFEPQPVLPPMLKYLQKKVGSGYEDFYNRLRSFALAQELDKVEELFDTYKIGYKYQSLFWKELYQETAKKEE